MRLAVLYVCDIQQQAFCLIYIGMVINAFVISQDFLELHSFDSK